MKPTRLFAYLMAAVALASSLLAYLSYVHTLGFPDGHITELGRAERRLAYVFIGVSLVSASCFIYLGAAASRKRIGRKLSAAVVLYSVSVLALFLVDNYYRAHLDDGVGG